MIIAIYNLNMEKVHSICDEPLEIMDVDADNKQISIRIKCNVVTVTENKLQIDSRIYEIGREDYQYIKIE